MYVGQAFTLSTTCYTGCTLRIFGHGLNTEKPLKRELRNQSTLCGSCREISMDTAPEQYNMDGVLHQQVITVPNAPRKRPRSFNEEENEQRKRMRGESRSVLRNFLSQPVLPSLVPENPFDLPEELFANALSYSEVEDLFHLKSTTRSLSLSTSITWALARRLGKVYCSKCNKDLLQCAVQTANRTILICPETKSLIGCMKCLKVVRVLFPEEAEGNAGENPKHQTKNSRQDTVYVSLPKVLYEESGIVSRYAKFIEKGCEQHWLFVYWF